MRIDCFKNPVSWKAEIDTQRHFDDARAHAGGSRRVHVERRDHDDCFGQCRAALAQRGDGEREDAFVEAVGEHQLLRRHS